MFSQIPCISIEFYIHKFIINWIENAENMYIITELITIRHQKIYRVHVVGLVVVQDWKHLNLVNLVTHIHNIHFKCNGIFSHLGEGYRKMYRIGDSQLSYIKGVHLKWNTYCIETNFNYIYYNLNCMKIKWTACIKILKGKEDLSFTFQHSKIIQNNLLYYC